MMKKYAIVPLMALVFCLAGCQTDSRTQVLDTSKSQVQLRAYQTRAYETTDRDKMLRTIIGTLQDLAFVVDKADATLGTVSATKLNGYALRITVTIRPRGTTQILVRANAQYNITPVEDPTPYQQFFEALSKAMFLEGQQVDA
ncbi:hypothetical protein [Azospirillum griseum]|uniref:DUF4410 domain-containing protein n=1 Tax=Azospirillum griseum TaxID=2496639 RepID=A0A3S0K870_9PROT|nr:hypothetical protein [Azospirillum griseum]RTR24406.1 hypothetical protein EJ903_01160 [Azospirillum griseum]